MSHYIEEELQKLIPSNNPYIIYNDTDSGYLQIDEFVERAFKDKPDATLVEKTDFCDKFYKQIIDPVVQKSIDDFANELNAMNPSVIGCEREIIADCLAPNTKIKIKQNGKTKIITISKLARMFGINTTKKYEHIEPVDNIQIISVQDGKQTLNNISNIQQKVTTKEMYKLELPNGKCIVCTEDHLIGVNVGGRIEFKKVIEIDEFDDVIYNDLTTYNKDNCKLYDDEYVNYGTIGTDLSDRGTSISITKRRNSKIKEYIFLDRLKNVEQRYKNQWHKLILRFLSKTVHPSKSIKYIISNNLFEGIDIKLLIKLHKKKHLSRKLFMKKWRYKKQFGVSKYRPNNVKISHFFKRCRVITRKKERVTKSTNLHTDKHNYRMKVQKFTNRTKKNNHILNLDKCDKYNFNLDHLVPIMEGFRLNIPPELISDIKNLKVIPKIENIKKRTTVDITEIDKVLFKEYIHAWM